MRIVDCLQKQKYLLFLPGQRRVRDTRYNWRLCEDSERGDASLISQSLPLCFCEISPSQAQPGQLCLCQTIPLLTLLHFRKPQIKCERGATGGMIPRVCGETDVWCANTELEHQPLSALTCGSCKKS